MENAVPTGRMKVDSSPNILTGNTFADWVEADTVLKRVNPPNPTSHALLLVRTATDSGYLSMTGGMETAPYLLLVAASAGMAR